MGYASISLYRKLTNQNKSIISDDVLNSILPIADRLVNKSIATKVALEQLDGQIDGSNKDFRTAFAPICDTTMKNVTVADNCDTADFDQSTDATADTLAGSLSDDGGSSIAMGKSGTSEATINYSKASTSVDGTGRRLKVTVFIKDLQQLDQGNAMEVRIGSGASDYYTKSFTREELRVGNNEVDINLLDMGTSGTPVITALDFIFIEFNVPASSDTITAGDLKMDNWRLEDIDSPDASDVEVFYATNDDTTGWRELGSAQTVSSIQDKDGIIVMSTAPTTTTAEAGVFANYSYVSRTMDWQLVNSAACYLAAHIAGFIIAGQAPNYTQIDDVFARRDVAGVPDEWLRLSLSLLIDAVGTGADGVGFRRVDTEDLT